MQMEIGQRLYIYKQNDTAIFKRSLGFVDRTKGGFYRGYNFAKGLGVGPFARFEDAEKFVRLLRDE